MPFIKYTKCMNLLYDTVKVSVQNLTAEAAKNRNHRSEGPLT